MSNTDNELADAIRWETAEDERHSARTDDGWNVALYRYRPNGPALGMPVILGHGLAGSRYIFDVHEDYSMARALAARGLDVWLVDLRGANDSWPDDGPSRSRQWTFDDFVFRDLPAVTEYVADATGRETVHWVGTEMSGIALYAAVISQSAPRITAGVTMGAPAITPPEAEVPGVTTPFPQRSGARYEFAMVADVGPQLARDRSEVLDTSFLTTNTDWVVTARYFAHGVGDEATRLVDQFRDWMEHATMRSLGHSVVWSDRLAEFDIPVLVIAVGHDDLVAGLTAPTNTFPLVADWLLAHD